MFYYVLVSQFISLLRAHYLQFHSLSMLIAQFIALNSLLHWLHYYIHSLLHYYDFTGEFTDNLNHLAFIKISVRISAAPGIFIRRRGKFKYSVGEIWGPRWLLIFWVDFTLLGCAWVYFCAFGYIPTWLDVFAMVGYMWVHLDMCGCMWAPVSLYIDICGHMVWIIKLERIYVYIIKYIYSYIYICIYLIIY